MVVPRSTGEILFDYVQPTREELGPYTNIIALDLFDDQIARGHSNEDGDSFVDRKTAVMNALSSMKDEIGSAESMRLALLPYATHPSIVHLPSPCRPSMVPTTAVHAYVDVQSDVVIKSSNARTGLGMDSSKQWSASFRSSVDSVIQAVAAMKARGLTSSPDSKQRLGQQSGSVMLDPIHRHARVIDTSIAILEAQASRESNANAGAFSPPPEMVVTNTSGMTGQGTVRGHLMIVAAPFMGAADGEEPELTGDEMSSIAHAIVQKCASSARVHLTVNVVLISRLAPAMDDACFSFFQKLTSGTGGVLRIHATAGPACLESIRVILSRRATESDASSVISVRCSSNLRIMKALHRHDIQLKRFKPTNIWSSRCENPTFSTSSIALLLHRVDAGQQSMGKEVVQVAWNFADLVGNGCHIQRIVTARSSIVNSDLVGSLDWVDASALVAKSVAKQALDTNASAQRLSAELLRRQVRSQLRELAEGLGLKRQQEKKWWFGRSSKPVLGREALPLAHTAHWMFFQALSVNGPLRRIAIFESLLSAPMTIARRMCCPELYAVLPPAKSTHRKGKTTGESAVDYLGLGLGGPAIECLPMPAVDVALALSLWVVLDAGNVIYIWRNDDLLSSYSVPPLTIERIEAACTSTARQIADSRWPLPDVVHLPTADIDVLQARLMAISDTLQSQAGLSQLLAGLDVYEAAAAVRETSRVRTRQGVAPLLRWLSDDAEVSIRF